MMTSSMVLTEQVDKLHRTVVTFGFQGGWYREGGTRGRGNPCIKILVTEGESIDRTENSEEATFSKLFNLILILELFNPNRWLVASVLAVVCKRMQQLPATCNNM